MLIFGKKYIIYAKYTENILYLTIFGGKWFFNRLAFLNEPIYQYNIYLKEDGGTR